MNNFKCYRYYKASDEEKCFIQCAACERKELLEKSDAGSVPLDETNVEEASSEYVKTLSGVNYKSLFDFATQNKEAFKAGAEWRAETSYSKEDMIIFGGFCIGRRMTNPFITGGELWDQWNKDFRPNGKN